MITLGKTASLTAGVSHHGRTASVLNKPPDRAYLVQHHGSRRAGLTLASPTRVSLLVPNRKCQNEVESGIKTNVS